jgi:predicted nucleic acid-binding protein
MAYLLDSNVLLRLAHSGDPRRPTILAAAAKLNERGEELLTSPQNYVEFWSVVTRPTAQNGFGLTPAEAHARVRHVMALFPVLPDSESIFDEWLRVVSVCSVSGKQVHDARLVAVMLAHGVENLLTFNTVDFSRYESLGVTAVNPSEV